MLDSLKIYINLSVENEEKKTQSWKEFFKPISPGIKPQEMEFSSNFLAVSFKRI